MQGMSSETLTAKRFKTAKSRILHVNQKFVTKMITMCSSLIKNGYNAPSKSVPQFFKQIRMNSILLLYSLTFRQVFLLSD